jgi:hypothetical protein
MKGNGRLPRNCSPIYSTITILRQRPARGGFPKHVLVALLRRFGHELVAIIGQLTPALLFER